MRDYLYILIIAAAVTYLLTPLVRRGSIAIGALHAARSRDVHVEPTPLLGGLAMYAGLVAGLLVADRLSYLREAFPSSRTVVGLLLAGGLLVLVGIVDDRWGMGAISKLAAQIAAGGILMWSGVYVPWVPLPGGQIFSLEPSLSATLTILIIVITVNAVNFIDGLDGLAAGVVAIAAVSFLIYSYTLTNSVGIPSQSVPAVASALLAGICIGVLPHNFNPARIFMGDTGAMLLGLLLAYLPISSTASLDQNVLTNYAHLHPPNRFATVLPLLLPSAILIIPYSDFILAVIRRTAAGKSPMSPDRQHLHHRLLNMGHSHRQSVLIMYLWAALFSGSVVALSLAKTPLVWLALATVGAMAVLMLATMPRLRPWRSEANGKQQTATASPVRSGESGSVGTYGGVPVNGPIPGAELSGGYGPAPDGQAAGSVLPVNGVLQGAVPSGAAPANVTAPGGTLPARGARGARGARPGGSGALPAHGALPGGALPAHGALPGNGPASPNGTVSPNGPAPDAGARTARPRRTTW
jgi:UDP-GlcNAc:undecaprenyl-phosphate GlcNAc-1-phosphate transferase